jgi:phosphatidylglycerophosphatase A
MTKIYKTLATFFGAGYAPVAPGTAGALVAAIFVYIWQSLDPGLAVYGWPLVGITIITFFVGVYCTDQLESEWGKDPSKVVIDEAIGIWISIFFIPVSIYYLFVGFVLFRIFDIWKPLGIRKLENIKGGWGVMLDDVLAGVYANIVLQVAVFYFN